MKVSVGGDGVKVADGVSGVKVAVGRSGVKVGVGGSCVGKIAVGVLEGGGVAVDISCQEI